MFFLSASSFLQRKKVLIKVILINFFMKALFIPAKYSKKLSTEFMKKIAESLKDKNVGMFTTIQFMEQMDELKEFLESNGKKVLIGNPDYRAIHKGQVLGCDVSSPLSIEGRIDTFIYLGSGIFHQLNLAVQTEKPIIQANPLTETVSTLSKEQVTAFKKKREQTLKKAMSGKVFGILICTKKGQCMQGLAEKTKEFLESKNKKVYTFLFETLNPDETYNFPEIEVWVNTACYRIGLDDVDNYSKPIVNAEDLLKEWN